MTKIKLAFFYFKFETSFVAGGNSITTDTFDFETLIAAVNRQETKQGVVSLVENVLQSFNIDRAFYLFIPREHLYNKASIALHHWGYPPKDPLIESVGSIISLEEEIPFMSLRGYDLKAPFYGIKLPINAPSVKGWEQKEDAYMAFTEYQGLIIPMISMGVKEGYMALEIEKECVTPLLTCRLHLIFQCIHQKYGELDALETHLEFNFTPREIELMMWIVAGKNQTYISKAMKISRHTVNGYIRNLFLKLRVDNRVSAAMKIDRLNLIVPHYADLKSPEILNITEGV